MSSKTKIVVLRMKEIIYTGIFVGLAILLVTLCLIMFRPKKDTAGSEAASYIPGVYSASLNLGNQDVNVQVAVDANRISSVSLVPLSEAVTTLSLIHISYRLHHLFRALDAVVLLAFGNRLLGPVPAGGHIGLCLLYTSSRVKICPSCFIHKSPILLSH